MALVYPEDRVDNGIVIDGRPVNRTLGRYCAEMGGMLDRDNFILSPLTTTTVPAISGTNAASSATLSGPWHNLWCWRSAATQTISAQGKAEGVQVENVGGQIETGDSGLTIEFSYRYEWGATGTGSCEFYITVDGATVDRAGAMFIQWERHPGHLVGYVPVGAGAHNVRAYVRVYDQNPFTDPPSFAPATADLNIIHRELFVVEDRR